MKIKKYLYSITHKNLFTNIKSNGKSGFNYRTFLYKDNEYTHKASFWHDIDYVNKNFKHSYNMVVEIPKGEMAKLEMSKKESFNPILQDTKKSKLTNTDYLRYYKLTPNFNYGFIPRTWENNKIKTLGNYIGDNDPLDIVELSDNSRMYTGKVLPVYIVGSFCLIDQDEVDWKILAVNANLIEYEDSINYLKDEKNLKKVKEIQNWFKIYKIYEGKKENTIYDNDRIFDIEETHKIIEENYNFYMNLISAKD